MNTQTEMLLDAPAEALEGGRCAVAICSAPTLTWGVDGYGTRDYLCARCEEVFGPVDPDMITHKCTKA